MTFDVKQFDLLQSLLHWGAVMLVSAVVALFVGTVISFLVAGARGPTLVFGTIKRGIVDLTRLSPRRIWALAILAFKESFARRALYVLGVFVILFMAANLFLRTPAEDVPAKPYVSFVLTAVTWILIPVAILLSCWGLPADIKDRSLHTVVTKPVRRSEVVIGRMLGYGLVVTLVLAIVAPIGWVWIQRVVPPRSQSQLTSRVPIFSEKFHFIDRNGEPQAKGINVGDIWDYRSYIEGQTRSRAVWTFSGLDPDSLGDEGLDLEYRFEVFRSHKGNVEQGEGVRFRLMLVNEQKDLRVPFPQRGAGQEIQEFAGETVRAASEEEEAGRQAVLTIPRELAAQVGPGELGDKVDLYTDLIHDGRLTVEVSCEDSGQYLGAAQADLFVRLPDRPFASGYFKAMLGIWLMTLLIIMIGTAASCFLKGPVATLMTFGLVILGSPMRSYLEEQLTQLGTEGKVLGGGMLESAYRLFTQMNVQSPLPDSPATQIIQWLDSRIFNALAIVENVVPDFNHFNMTAYVANGFDVPFDSAGAAVLPSLMTVLGYLLPLVVLGYFSLQLRELESK